MNTQNENKNKKFLFVAIAGMAVLIGVVAYYVIQGFGRVATDDAYVTGRIHSIASRVTGTVQKVHVEDNQRVKKGELLVEIDPVDYGLKVNEAVAALDVRKANLEQMARDKVRAEELYRQNVFSKEKYEHALTDHDLAKAQVRAASQQLKIAQTNLGYTKMYAPADGYVTQKSVEDGNQIQAGQPLMAVVALDDIWVVANYKETQLKGVKTGQRVLIKIDTYPGRGFTGKVDSIMAGTGAVFSLFPPENALGNYVKVVQRVPVKIVFDSTADERHILRIGMSCIPTIIVKDE